MAAMQGRMNLPNISNGTTTQNGNDSNANTDADQQYNPRINQSLILLQQSIGNIEVPQGQSRGEKANIYRSFAHIFKHKKV